MSLLLSTDVTTWVPQASGQSAAMVLEAIAMAEGLADAYCDCALESASHDEYYSIKTGQERILLRHVPVTAITTVYDDAQATVPSEIDADDYVYDPATGILEYPFVVGMRTCRVVYTAGYTSATMPEALKRALLQIVAWVFGFRGNVGYKSLSAEGTSETLEPIVNGLPISLGEALEPWRRGGLG